MSVAIAILLAIAVASAWLAAVGFLRLESALDRLHCVAFVYVGCGLPVVAAAFLADGASSRAFKVLLLVLICFVAGASVNQSVARAIFARDETGERN